MGCGGVDGVLLVEVVEGVKNGIVFIVEMCCCFFNMLVGIFWDVWVIL